VIERVVRSAARLAWAALLALPLGSVAGRGRNGASGWRAQRSPSERASAV
jgi:hypothetical protein